jgi:hypothetical protein
MSDDYIQVRVIGGWFGGRLFLLSLLRSRWLRFLFGGFVRIFAEFLFRFAPFAGILVDFMDFIAEIA